MTHLSKLLGLMMAAGACATSFAQDATVVVNADMGQTTISRHIYGHFSEHLGHCIYGGLWVGKDSNIPNVNEIGRASCRERV